MAGTKDFFGRPVRTCCAASATRWRLKAEPRAVRAGDLTRKFAKIEHLSAFRNVREQHIHEGCRPMSRSGNFSISQALSDLVRAKGRHMG
jgi:hypothetical protein